MGVGGAGGAAGGASGGAGDRVMTAGCTTSKIIRGGGGAGALDFGGGGTTFPTCFGAVAGDGDEPPHQIRSYTLLFSLFLHFPYITDPPLPTSALTRSHSHDNCTHSIGPISLI